MMLILVKSDDNRSGRKAKAHRGQLWVAQESMGYNVKLCSQWSCVLLNTFFKKEKGLLVDRSDHSFTLLLRIKA